MEMDKGNGFGGVDCDLVAFVVGLNILMTEDCFKNLNVEGSWEVFQLNVMKRGVFTRKKENSNNCKRRKT